MTRARPVCEEPAKLIIFLPAALFFPIERAGPLMFVSVSVSVAVTFLIAHAYLKKKYKKDKEKIKASVLLSGRRFDVSSVQSGGCRAWDVACGKCGAGAWK